MCGHGGGSKTVPMMMIAFAMISIITTTFLLQEISAFSSSTSSSHVLHRLQIPSQSSPSSLTISRGLSCVRPRESLWQTKKCSIVALRSTTTTSSASASTESEEESAVTEGGSSTMADSIPLVEPFGVGVKRDLSRRLPLYWSDITDGVNAQSFATTLFLFFACLAPAIGFGGLLDVATNGAMGAMEMVLATSGCGVLYALLAAQPIQLIGPMGPNLAYTISLFHLSQSLSLPFLPLYAWTGLWMAGILGMAAMTSACNVVQYLTRFTDEIFSVLISTIFLFEAVMDITKTFTTSAVTPATALLTLTCAMVTFGSALTLKGLKTSVYFTKTIRNQLSNFAPAIGVTLGSLIARGARLNWGITLPILSLPTQFGTTTGRPWWIPLGSLPMWARWSVALPAALLASVLLFLDQNITARLVNHPRYKMVKGRDTHNVLDGMHGDMLVLSLLTGLCSVIGLPWMAGATTRSAAHVRSLTKTDSNNEIVGTLENRVSGAAIHALIGAVIVLAAPRTLLRQVPLPVLSGVFLYLGYTSLSGLELWQRIQGLLQDPSVAPKVAWSSLKRRTSVLLTVIQMTCVGGMMWVTKSSFGVLSPLLVALLPLIRWTIIRSGIISKSDMEVLDS